MGFLKNFDVTFDDIDELVTDNPSLRSFVMGYLAELKCRDNYFLADDRIEGLRKYDDHDRTKKGDICVVYKGQEINIEVKSLQTNSIRLPKNPPKKPKPGWTSPYFADTSRVATFQCDASDKRRVTFKDESSVETTSLLVGEFDVLAVCLFGFDNRWDFAFAKNQDLPRVSGRHKSQKEWTQYQKENLLATSMPMFYPTAAPIYSLDPFTIFDDVLTDRAAGKNQSEVADVKLLPKKKNSDADEFDDEDEPAAYAATL